MTERREAQVTEEEFDRQIGVHTLSNERLKAALQRIGAKSAKRIIEERDRRVWAALETHWREDHVKKERKANREMSANHLADKIHELRGDRCSLQRAIENLRAKGEVPPGDLLADLRRVGNDLLVALDDRAERI